MTIISSCGSKSLQSTLRRPPLERNLISFYQFKTYHSDNQKRIQDFFLAKEHQGPKVVLFTTGPHYWGNNLTHRYAEELKKAFTFFQENSNKVKCTKALKWFNPAHWRLLTWLLYGLISNLSKSCLNIFHETLTVPFDITCCCLVIYGRPETWSFFNCQNADHDSKGFFQNDTVIFMQDHWHTWDDEKHTR